MMLLKLPSISLLDILFKLTPRSLVQLRQCTRKINNFVEEHRFTISRKSRSDIIIDVIAEKSSLRVSTGRWRRPCKSVLLTRPYEELSALSFYQIRVKWHGQKEELGGIITLLSQLKLSCLWLCITILPNVPAKEEMEFAFLVDHSNLILEFYKPVLFSDIVSYEILQKPMDHLILYISNKSEYPFLHEIMKNKKDVEFIFTEENHLFSLDAVLQATSNISETSSEIPKLHFWWQSDELWDIEFPHFFPDLKLLFKKLRLGKYAFDDHLIYGKALPSKLLILDCNAPEQALFMDVIEKSKSALRGTLEKCAKEKMDDAVLEHLYNCLVNEE